MTNLVFHVTTACNIRCAHCFMDSESPNQSSAMRPEDAFRWMEESHASGIVFTGGEPFLEYDNLIKMIKRASELNIYSLVTTNGFWAKDLKTAKEKADALVTAGLNELCLGVDKYHQKYIPLDNIKNAIATAQAAGIHVVVNSTFLESPGENYNLISEIKRCAPSVKIRNSLMMRIGRAESDISGFSDVDFPASSIVFCTGGNRSRSATVIPDGTTTLCTFGAATVANKDNPLVLGNAYKTPLSELIANQQDDPLRFAICNPLGFKRIVTLLDRAGLSHKLKGRAGSLCELCCRIFGDEEMVAALRTPASQIMLMNYRRSLSQVMGESLSKVGDLFS